MAEPVAVGRPLRLYQLLLVLGLGWAAGRLPDLLAEAGSTARHPGRPNAPASAAAPLSAELAAAIAADVASRVAGETVARLVAAGWGPNGAQPPNLPGPPYPAPRRPPVAPEAVVRIVTEPPPPADAAGYRLPPMAAPREAQRQPEARPPPAPEPLPPPRAAAFALATEGYAALRGGDRRTAAERLAEALALDPKAPEAKAWSADLRQLSRHVSGNFYALLRQGAFGDALGATPILGSSQAGALIGYTLDPLARRRVTAFARFATGSMPGGTLDPETSEAAVGLRFDPVPRVPVHLAVERRIALGSFARNAWSARVAGGTFGETPLAGRRLLWDVYGEGGVIGVSEPDLYAGAQARVLTPLARLDRVRLDAGAAVWAAGQQAFVSSHRFDVGPAARLSFPNLPVSAQIDYRLRVAGNAEPGSGLALTLLADL